MSLRKAKLRLSHFASGEKNLQTGRVDWLSRLPLCLLWVTLRVEVLLSLRNRHQHTGLRGQVPFNLLASTETKILRLLSWLWPALNTSTNIYSRLALTEKVVLSSQRWTQSKLLLMGNIKMIHSPACGPSSDELSFWRLTVTLSKTTEMAFWFGRSQIKLLITFCRTLLTQSGMWEEMWSTNGKQVCSGLKVSALFKENKPNSWELFFFFFFEREVAIPPWHWKGRVISFLFPFSPLFLIY